MLNIIFCDVKLKYLFGMYFIWSGVILGTTVANIECDLEKIKTVNCRRSVNDRQFFVTVNFKPNINKNDISSFTMKRCKVSNLEMSLFEGFSSLINMDLSDNNIANLNRDCFVNVPQLQSLDLSKNLLMYVDPKTFESNKKLKKLDLSENLLFLQENGQSLNFASSLQKLHLSYNSPYINYLYEASNLASIETISIGDKNLLNRLSDLYFRKPILRDVKIPNCNKLELAFNSISKVSLESTVLDAPMMWFNLSYNNLTEVESDVLVSRKLYVADLRGNQLNGIPDDFFLKASSVFYIDLSMNRIKKLHPQQFDRLKTLRHLNISYNLIEQLDANIFPEPGLQILGISHNNLEILPEGIFTNTIGLITLDLSHNKLTGLSRSILEKQGVLRYLDLSHNEIQHLTNDQFDKNPALIQINLSGNRMKSIPDMVFSQNPNIKCLDLSSNEIDSISDTVLMPLTNLIHLSISDNKFMDLPDRLFFENKILEVVDLSRNRLEEIGSALFINNLNMKELFLSGNNLDTLQFRVLRHLRQLERLYLNNNQLFQIDSDLMTIDSLRELSLSCNILSGIFPEFLKNVKPIAGLKKKVFFHGNPWKCNCINEVLNIKNSAVSYETKLFTDGSASCVVEDTSKDCGSNSLPGYLLSEFRSELNFKPHICNTTLWLPPKRLNVCDFTNFNVNYKFFSIPHH